MGQAQPGRNTLRRPGHLHKTAHIEGKPKSFCISYQHWKIKVSVSDDTVTCGWLLSEVIRKCKAPGNIVALRTRANIEILDYWLTRMERTLQPLTDSEELEPVFAGKHQLADVPDYMCKDHFEPIKLIGKGGFSRVIEVRKRDTGELYAIKIMNKSFLVKEEKVHQILTERKIMMQTTHPFIVKLHWAFQSVCPKQRTELFLVMDFCPGGELFFHLHNLGRLTEDQAQFYFAEILLGLEHLHANDIIYRDLKPENVLLDVDGHVRLTDFGLSKQNITKDGISFSFCGSPEYMSPEMLRGGGHGRAVDYYSLGALLYEMLTGLPPFYDKNRAKMYKAIQSETLKLPNYVSRAVRSMLSGLLEKDPALRLGAANGFEEIKQHIWCKSIQWDRLLKKKKAPPFIPNLRLSNFDPEYTSAQVDFSSISSEPPLRADDPFSSFDYAKDGDISPVSGIYRSIPLHSKSASDISNVSTSDTKSQGVGSRNVSQVQAMTVIQEEDEFNTSPRDIDVTMLKVFLPEHAPYQRTEVQSDSESWEGRRPRPALPMDPIPKGATPARYEKEIDQRKHDFQQVKSKTIQGIHLHGPEPSHVKIKKVLPSPLSFGNMEEEVSAKFWEDSSGEESIVNEIPDFLREKQEK